MLLSLSLSLLLFHRRHIIVTRKREKKKGRLALELHPCFVAFVCSASVGRKEEEERRRSLLSSSSEQEHQKVTHNRKRVIREIDRER